MKIWGSLMVKKTVCVDVDRTLMPDMPDEVPFGSYIDPFPGAKEFLKKLQEQYRVVIYTMRTGRQFQLEHGNDKTVSVLVLELAEWLDQHGLPYDDIWCGQGKPHAEFYVDDRAVQCRPGENDNAFTEVLKEVL